MQFYLGTLSKRIKKLREDKGFSKRKLAIELNVSDTAIGDWEDGKTIPNAAYVFALAHFFSVSADYIVGLTSNPYPQKPL